MTITKTLIINSNGRKIEIEIERTKDVQDNISYADGWNINLGKKTVDSIYIRVFVDGICKTTAYNAPHIIAEQGYHKSYKDLKAKGVYARLGDVYLTETNYNKIMALIAEIDAEIKTTDEYKDVKAQEDAKEAIKVAAEKEAAERYQKLLDSGMCPKCGTWCYGECEAH